MAMALAVLHIGLAIIVTVDVLLKKSDVRGALGWIGAVWFAPILGSLIYYLFGINRVTRRALKFSRLREKPAHPSAATDVETAPNLKSLCAGQRARDPDRADSGQCLQDP